MPARKTFSARQTLQISGHKNRFLTFFYAVFSLSLRGERNEIFPALCEETLLQQCVSLLSSFSLGQANGVPSSLSLFPQWPKIYAHCQSGRVSSQPIIWARCLYITAPLFLLHKKVLGSAQCRRTQKRGKKETEPFWEASEGTYTHCVHARIRGMLNGCLSANKKRFSIVWEGKRAILV